MNLHFFTFFLFFYAFFTVFGQNNQSTTTVFGREKEAYQLFLASRYDEAIAIYDELLKKPKNSPDFVQRAYKNLFTMYKSMHNYQDALAWCKKYLEQNSKDSIARLEYADLLKINQQYEQALEVYTSLMSEKMKDPNLKKRYAETRWALLNQDSTREAIIIPTQFQMRDNLGFSIRKDTLYASAVQVSKDNKTPFYQIAKYQIKDTIQIDTLAKPLFDAQNNLINVGSPSFNVAGNEIYYSALENKKTYYESLGGKNANKALNNLRIYTAEIQANGKWSEPKVLDFCLPQYNYTHPFLTTDGKRLFFVSDQDNKFGNYDIFMVKKSGDTWGNPRKLGPNVNSDRTEMFPVLYKEYLFFASYGREGFGGADLFRSKMVGEQFEIAENLNQPINSSKDDFAIFFTDSVQNSGYFTSNRDNEKGHDALYYVRVLHDFALTEKPMTDSARLASEQRMMLIAALDQKSLEEVPTQVQIFEKNPNSVDSTLLVPKNGMVQLEKNKEYSAIITVETAKPQTQYIPSLQKIKGNELFLFVDDPNAPKLALTEKEVQALKPYKPAIEERLFFEFDRFNVLELEKIKLTKSIDILKQNSNLTILLEGHADSRGKDWYNDNLSRARVLKVIEYLQRQGIDRSQILFAFFGKRRLASVEENLNRRVEIKIVYKP